MMSTPSARWLDPNLIPWPLLLRGVRARTRACTRCGSRLVRTSRRPIGFLGQLLRLVTYRCEACRLLFALPRPREVISRR